MSWQIRVGLRLNTKSYVRVAVGVIKKGEKVLVAERPTSKPYSGYWEFPGGKIEAHETGEAALKRELREELGIEIAHAQAWFQHLHTYPDKTVQLEIWIIDQIIGEPQGRENQILRWVSFPEMLELRLLEGNYPILDKIKSLLGSV